MPKGTNTKKPKSKENIKAEEFTGLLSLKAARETENLQANCDPRYTFVSIEPDKFESFWESLSKAKPDSHTRRISIYFTKDVGRQFYDITKRLEVHSKLSHRASMAEKFRVMIEDFHRVLFDIED